MHASTAAHLQQDQTTVANEWDSIATNFDRFTTPHAIRHGDSVIARAGVQTGTRVLDVAAGSGALSIPAARRGAQVLATDISQQMITLLQNRARAEGLVNLDARVMDGNAMDLPDNTFDVTVSQNGVSVFPDFVQGLSEMARVTRPGGRVVVVCFGPVQRAEFLTFFMAALTAVAPDFCGLPTNPPPLPFQIADPNVLRERLEDARLSSISVEEATWEMQFDSGTHLWDTVTSSNPIAVQLVSRLSDAQRKEAKHILDGMLRERSGTTGGVVNNAINIGIGTKAENK